MRRLLFIFYLMVTLLFGCSSGEESSPYVPNSNSSKAIAVWAYPDGVSVPYRDDDNQIISGSITYMGVAAYHASGISSVAFSINGGTSSTVSIETLNPETNEYEYVLQLDPDTLGADGEYTISATAYPNDGEETQLPDLKIQKDIGTHGVLYAGGGGYATLDEACVAASGGDIIKVRSGTYALPDQTGYDFTKYVTIMPDGGAAVIITGGSLRSSYFKFADITFDLSSPATDAVISSQYTHFWIDNCTVIGLGKDVSDNNTSAFRFYNASEYAVIENCTMHDMSLGATVSAGKYIIRNNIVYDVTADGFGYNGDNVLVTGNTIHDNHLPPGGDQHCDFISSNNGADQVILRNNYCYNGDHQGVKLGGYNDGRDQPYANIAIINNLFATGINGSVNMRLEGTTKGKRFSNVLIEYNTVWNGSSHFVIEPDVSASHIYVRNNIFGPDDVSDMSGITNVTIDNNCYHIAPATGANSIVGDPLFTNQSIWNFTLQNASPCIAKADISSGIFYDINFNIRGAIPDMGAYENSSR